MCLCEINESLSFSSHLVNIFMSFQISKFKGGFVRKYCDYAWIVDYYFLITKKYGKSGAWGLCTCVRIGTYLEIWWRCKIGRPPSVYLNTGSILENFGTPFISSTNTWFDCENGLLMNIMKAYCLIRSMKHFVLMNK